MFSKWALLILGLCFLLLGGRSKKMSREACSGVFGEAKMGPRAHVRITGTHFRKAGVVCICGVVCVCGECHGVSMRVK